MTEFPPLQCSSAFVPWLIQASGGSKELSTKIINLVKNKNQDLLELLAINALEFTAPVASGSFYLKPDQETDIRNFIQVSGHPGSLAPAGPNTLWKKYVEGSSELEVYEYLSRSTDSIKQVIPNYYSKTHWNDDLFLELEDLLHGFSTPQWIMDIKMGSRTFLESEASNTKLREDLFEKMVKTDPSAPTAEELKTKKITKLRYMTWREEQSSTSSLSFRIEGIKFGNKTNTNLKKVKTETEVAKLLNEFVHSKLKEQLVARLKLIRNCLEESSFFSNHEVIGSSLLIIHDNTRVGAWIIDFGKTVKSPVPLKHRTPWVMGNHEDGYLIGLDNLIRILETKCDIWKCCRGSVDRLIGSFKSTKKNL